MNDDDLPKIESETQDGVCLVDEQGLIIEWSPGQEALTGLARMEVLGRSIWDVQFRLIARTTRDAEEYARLRKVFLQMLDTGQVPPNLRLIDIAIEKPDGTRGRLQVSVSPIKTNSGYMLSCLCRDVTRQKRWEMALQEARASAELANHAKGQFLARMSHEIRTPLHGIAGMAELLSGTSLSPEQEEYLKVIRSSADLLLLEVNDVLDFSKIESGRLDLEEVAFDLREVVERTSDAVALRASEKGLELVIDLCPSVPTGLQGDPARLQQVLVNLLNNAVKFTDTGQVVLTVRIVADDAESVSLTFTVQDSGIGISEENQSLIFEAFRQSDGSTTRQYGGTGLGLSIAEQLVELMGGRIRVGSKPGRGSRFQFFLTFKKQPAANPSETPTGWPSFEVLICVDNEAARSALNDTLTYWGLEASLAEDGQKALDALDEARTAGRPFRLVLLDSTLPDQNGLVLGASIMNEMQVPVVMLLPAARFHQDLQRCGELGINNWVMKPCKPTALMRAMERVLDKAPNPSGAPQVESEQPSPSPANRPTPTLRILLADDNQVGQVIGRQMLTGLGHTVETATNGQEVLSKLEAAKFDLVLMDVEMPLMDGLEAARVIRKREADLGCPPIWIVAVTAYASIENRRAVMEAGMDAYLSKPFKAEKLRETLQPFIDRVESSPASQAFDRRTALEATSGSEEILDEVVGVFFNEDYPRQLRDIAVAIEKGDGEMLRKASHGLKGALATFGAAAAADRALELQEIGMRGEMDLAPRKLLELRAEVGRFAACISLLRESIAESTRGLDTPS